MVVSERAVCAKKKREKDGKMTEGGGRTNARQVLPFVSFLIGKVELTVGRLVDQQSACSSLFH